MRRLVLAIVALLAVGSALHGQNNGAQLKRGEMLLARHCGACHAVGRTGASPRRLAMPFRDISKHYAVESLEEALAEGLISGHPEMPEFMFSADDVGAVIVYLKSIQAR